ncbi:MAG: MFS transporter [Armatimonadetes bacterium]|nr:MFS transporter [Armatimonadota bacterium]
MQERTTGFLGLTGYQWLVFAAAWLGWGFDAFDALLFNYVAPGCISSLLHLTPGTPEARAQISQWTGILTSMLLLGWAVGGILMGRLADRIGRSRTLMLTMLIYSVATAACALVNNIWELMFFRVLASLGIGGEWAAGAAMVAEVVPEKRRVEMGALLYTAAPLGVFMAGWVSHWMTQEVFPGQTEVSWRYVFLFGLLPAAVAMAVRWFIQEPERWHRHEAATVGLSALFRPEYRRLTFSGLGMAVTALLAWWCSNAFLPLVAESLGMAWASAQGLAQEATRTAALGWKASAINLFNLGGLFGTLLTIPTAKLLGRRATFGIYFLLSGVITIGAFGLPLEPGARMAALFLMGMTNYGVLGSFTYYLPELFPTRLRGTGSGFCYNVGRVITAAGPYVVGAVAASGVGMVETMAFAGFIPLAGLLLLPWVVETRGQQLAD